MKKKVLIYFNSLQPSGGIERVISTLSNKLSCIFEVTVLVKDCPTSFYPLNTAVKLVSLDNALKLNMDSQVSRVFSIVKAFFTNHKLLKHFLNHNSYDFYYVAHPLNALEMHLARGTDHKTIVTEHGSQTAYNAVYKALKKYLYHKAKVYVVPTKSDTDLYRSMKFPATYVPHFRSNLPYENAKKANKNVLTIGRFTEVKQQILLLKAWNLVIKKTTGLDWKLNMVGSGELEQSFKDYIGEHQLEAYVDILPPRKDIEEYYKNASVFALTSSSEGFGMVLLEAISFGLPCISFDCPSGPRDIIANGINGFLIEQDNVVQFAEKLYLLISKTDILMDMGNNAFKMSKDWKDENVLNKWHKILSN